jgi:hypothetical protein
LSLSDDTYRRAEQLAGLVGSNITDVLVDALSIALPPLDEQTLSYDVVGRLSDSEVMALAESQMDPGAAERFSALQDKQRAGTIKNSERRELLAFLQHYQEGTLRKAQALRECVARGLREPLES